jgi:hypothetical protein
MNLDDLEALPRIHPAVELELCRCGHQEHEHVDARYKDAWMMWPGPCKPCGNRCKAFTPTETP